MRTRNKPGKHKTREAILAKGIREQVIKLYDESKKIKYYGLKGLKTLEAWMEKKKNLIKLPKNEIYFTCSRYQGFRKRKIWKESC